MRTLFFLAFLFSVQSVFSCTTFFINHNGQMVFGRNYDWVTGTGLLHTNLRGVLKKPYSSDSASFSWTSKYGSITFNQYGKEYPTGGMNEKGLVVELMWLDGSNYPDDDERAEIDVLQWIQYQLDNAETIEQVIASDKVIRISKDNPPLHYLVADKLGNAATIEFLNGKMVVHRGNELPHSVLTNSTYNHSLKSIGKNQNDNSLQRFGKACLMMEDFKKNNQGSATEHAFKMLDAVSQGDYTKWSIVYDLKKMTIIYKTEANKNRKEIAFSDFNFACEATPLVHDLNTSYIKRTNFKALTVSENESYVRKAADESKSHISISEATVRRMTHFTMAFRCKNQ